MRLIRSVLLPLELKSGFASSRINANSMAGQSPYFVRLYEDLVRMTASISSYNPDYMVLFRGQNNDYLDDATGRSLIMPSIYRANNGRELSLEELDSRFDVLGTACSLLESELTGEYKGLFGKEKTRFASRRVEQWALLQHYGICPTPLIDLTRSLRTACWFALHNADPSDSPVVYALGMPYMNGPLLLNSNDGLFQMELSGLMPPQAERPYFQKAVLVGSERPDRRKESIHESNLGVRVLAKFSIPAGEDWEDDLGIDGKYIYPKDDPFFKVANRIHLGLVTKGLVDPNETEVEAATVAIETMAQVLNKALAGMALSKKGAKG